MRSGLVLLTLLSLSISTLAQGTFVSGVAARGNYVGQTERQLRYQPEGTDFVIKNGTEFFNRPLYGTNTAFRVDAGDRPQLSLYLPGRGGVLRLGIRTGEIAKWLDDAQSITARYRPGSMIYEIRDPLLGDGTLHLAALPISTTEGLVLRVELSNTSTPIKLIWAYGGASGERGRRDGDIGTERVPISEFFQLKPEHCKDNSFSITQDSFTLKSKAATIAGIVPRGSKIGVANATKWQSAFELLASSGKEVELPVVTGESQLLSDQPSYLALQRVTESSVVDLPVYREVAPERPGQRSGPSASVLLPAYKVEDLPVVFESSERRRRELADTIVVNTPDPYINAAAAALAVAADGVWDEQQGAWMHGAVAWRTKLLGWRGPYVGDALGWHDRARRHFAYWATRQNTGLAPTNPISQDASVNFARNEPSLHTKGDMSNSHYDMNLVYIDALFRHLMWTGDLNFAREMWPVIERHLAWEQRLFRREYGPDHLPLYEAYAAIWASDDLQYNGGGATHSSAYNYRHNVMAAKLTRLLGKDAGPYEREADLILKAMRRELWLQDRGWFAEWKDVLGLQLAHPNPALWTFYHAIDSEVPTPFEAWQMSRFVDTQIAHIPIHGPGVPAGVYFTLPTTSWMPYTWSINNVVMAESAHTALAYWQAGRGDEAFRLFKGTMLDSMYMGLCPGNVGMTSYFDMARGEAQRDFADASGVLSRSLVEGLFGVLPNALEQQLVVRPGFPVEWDRAELRHSDVHLTFRRNSTRDTYLVEPHFPQQMKLRLQVNAHRDGIARVTVNGQPAHWRVLDDAVGQPRVEIESSLASRYEVVIDWKGAKPSDIVAPKIVAHGDELRIAFGSLQLLEVKDPQGTLDRVKRGPSSLLATAVGLNGHRTVFAKVRQGAMTWWTPISFEVRPPFEIMQAEKQDPTHLRFRVRNNTSSPGGGEVTIRASGIKTKMRLALPAFGMSDEIALVSSGLLPGSTNVVVELSGRRSVVGVVTNWKINSGARSDWERVDLSASFNDRLTNIFKNDYLHPRSTYVSLATPKQGIGSWTHFDEQFEVDDSGLRAASARGGGTLLLPQGVPFSTSGTDDANNIVFTSQWENYPSSVNIAIAGNASHIYLLMAGSTNWMQSRFDNGEVVVTYTDGSTERLLLQNPTNWWPIDQDYFLDDYAFRRSEPIPPRVDLASGMVRVLDPSEFRGKGGKVKGGAATVLDLPLRREKELKSLTVHTLANEVVIGLMAVTLARE